MSRSLKVAIAGLAACGLAVGLVAVVILVGNAPGLRSQLRSLPGAEALRPVYEYLAGSYVAERLRPLYYYYVRVPPKTAAEVGDGKNAADILLQDPMGLGEDGLGNVYVSDRGRHIWKIGPAGRAHVIAGTGRRGPPTTGAQARASALGSPEGLCVDGLGRIYFADSGYNVILRIETDGRLTRVAGTGMAGYAGDGGPATEALLNAPFEVRLDSAGSLYIADFGNHRIRKIDKEGIIHTVAGTGEPGYSGDGGAATLAQLNEPYGVFATADGRLLIADSENHVVREVDASGIIRTIAGVGEPGYAGDGGPATRAKFNAPQSLYVDGAGLIYIGDEHNHAVRVIRRDGTIATLAGNGTQGLSGDGSPAETAQLNDPENLLVRSDGSLLITDGDNGRVRLVTSDGIAGTFAGR